jgi:hypothetical protein
MATRIGNHDFSRDGVPDLDGSGLFVDVAARRPAVCAASRPLPWSGRRRIRGWTGTPASIRRWLCGHAGLAAQRVWDGRASPPMPPQCSVGRLAGDRFVGQERTPWLFELDIEAWMPVRVPGLPASRSWWASGGTVGQRRPAATRRFALGGAQRARGTSATSSWPIAPCCSGWRDVTRWRWASCWCSASSPTAIAGMAVRDWGAGRGCGDRLAGPAARRFIHPADRGLAICGRRIGRH